MAELTDKQAAFCREYIIDFNATQAAIRAGYSESTANQQASQNLVKLNIQSRIAELMQERNERVQVNADYVLNRLVEIDQMDALDILNDNGGVKPIKDWPKIWRQFISGFDISEIGGDEESLSAVVKKIKWPDKVKNLELIGKHTDVGAFKDRVEHTGLNGGPIQIETRPISSIFQND